MTETTSVESIKKMHKSLGEDGHWNYSDYTLGLFNGLELALAAMEDRNPDLRTLKAYHQETLQPQQQHQQSTKPQNESSYA